VATLLWDHVLYSGALLLLSRRSDFSFSHGFMSKYCVGIKIVLLWDTGCKAETMLIHFEMGLSRCAAF